MLRRTVLRAASTKSSSASNKKSVILVQNCCFHTNNKVQASVYEDLKNVNPDEAFPWVEHTVPKRHEQHPYEIASLSFNGLGSGKKPPSPIIFIHDYTTNSKVFSTIARKLNYPYGVVTMDLRGRGKTQVGDLKQLYTTQEEKERAFLQAHQSKTGPLNMITHALDFIRVLTYYGLPRAFVVGHGFGAYVAYMLMKKCPERISGAVLMNSGYPINKAAMGEVSQLHERVATTFNAPFETLFTQDGVVKSDNVDFKSFLEYTKNQKTDDAILAATKDLRSVEDYALSLNELIQLRHPVALIRSEHGLKDGDKKPIIDTKLFKTMETTLNSKMAVTINGSNHYNMLFEEKYAEEIANTIDRFVSQYDIHKLIEQRFTAVKGAETKVEE